LGASADDELHRLAPAVDAYSGTSREDPANLDEDAAKLQGLTPEVQALLERQKRIPAIPGFLDRPTGNPDRFIEAPRREKAPS
jgi:hypothetical protein